MSDIEQAVAEALRSPDHEQCRQNGPEAEAECLLAALAERGYHVTRSDREARLEAALREAYDALESMPLCAMGHAVATRRALRALLSEAPE